MEGGDEPLIELVEDASAEPPESDANVSAAERLAMMSVLEKMKVATRGTREERAILVRDPNRLVAAAVLSSPKLTGQEVEAIAKMANVGEDVLRVIGTNRQWTKNYGVVAGLVRNPKTPVAISLNLLQRVQRQRREDARPRSQRSQNRSASRPGSVQPTFACG